MVESLSATDILHVWELGASQHPLDRALTILRVAGAVRSDEDASRLSIGQRDARLLAVREATLGPTLASFTECPACREPLEFVLQAAEIRGRCAAPQLGEFCVSSGEIRLILRCLDSRDLAALLVAQPPDPRLWLLERCVVSATDATGSRLLVGELAEPVHTAVVEALAERDPGAVIQLDLRCPACEHRFTAIVDIVEFFWTELTAVARRALAEVAELARAYGWRETDILAMSARRRRVYLELARS